MLAERGPDLAREGRNRSLAAGAGDGRNGCGLPRIELRRRKCERAPHIGYVHQGDMVRQWTRRLAFGQYRDRAPCHRLRQEAQPIDLGAGHGDEQETGFHGPAVGRNSGHRQCAKTPVAAGLAGQKVT
jgi:hypothetical protein